jgi:hypothetical protein
MVVADAVKDFVPLFDAAVAHSALDEFPFELTGRAPTPAGLRRRGSAALAPLL